MSQADDTRRDANASDEANKTTDVRAADTTANVPTPNPRRTTTGRWLTTPKFGSAGSGGAELEPGLEKN